MVEKRSIVPFMRFDSFYAFGWIVGEFPGRDWAAYERSMAHETRDNHYIEVNAARAWAGLAMWCTCLTYDQAKCEVDCERAETQLNCRAWQALRDFLNGTPDQWALRVKFARVRSEQVGKRTSEIIRKVLDDNRDILEALGDE